MDNVHSPHLLFVDGIYISDISSVHYLQSWFCVWCVVIIVSNEFVENTTMYLKSDVAQRFELYSLKDTPD